MPASLAITASLLQAVAAGTCIGVAPTVSPFMKENGPNCIPLHAEGWP